MFLYVGGGNAANIVVPLPANVHIASNDAGITGGIRLWDEDIWKRRLRHPRGEPGALTGRTPASPATIPPSPNGIRHGRPALLVSAAMARGDKEPMLVAVGGLLAMAAGMGVGRFVYTPILPPMVEALSPFQVAGRPDRLGEFRRLSRGRASGGDAPAGFAPVLAAGSAGGQHALSRGDGPRDADAGFPGAAADGRHRQRLHPRAEFGACARPPCRIGQGRACRRCISPGLASASRRRRRWYRCSPSGRRCGSPAPP